MAQLAIDGGQPYRRDPFPARTPFGDREIELLTEAVRSQSLFGLGGKMVSAFEKGFAALYDAKYAVGSTSGTAAIHVAVGTIDPEPGDEIISAPITDGGGIVGIIYQNAIPVFADIDSSFNMDPRDIERKITPRTKAIVVVHLGGNPADMDAIMDVSRRHNVPVIEDCSQSHLTEYKGRLCGTMGDIAAFSLQQSKHMTTGDGGMTITNRDDLAERMMLFRDKGWTRKPGWGARTYDFLAPNYRMTELQGAVGLAQLEKVRSVVDRRHDLGDYLTELLRGVDGIRTAPVTDGGRHTYWFYPMSVDAWDAVEFAKALTAEGIPAGARYIGLPIYMCMEALASRKTFGKSGHPFDGCHGARQIDYGPGLCPRTEEELSKMVTLGLNENFSRTDIEDMAGAVRKVAESLPKGG